MPALPPTVYYLWREIAASPPATALGLAFAALLRGSRSPGTARGLVGAAVAGGAAWRLGTTLADLDRQARNAVDAPVINGWLGGASQPLGAWSIEPDFGRLVVDTVRLAQDRTIVELGSGLSTVLIARRLELLDSGRLFSVDHDSDFAAETRRLLEREALGHRVEIIEAPLRDQSIGGEDVPWYDVDLVLARLPDEIDCLIVDGPPAVTSWARWPALEVFEHRLRPGSTVLLDDGRRRAESRTARRWSADHPDFDLFYYDTVKGTWLLRRTARPPSPNLLQRLMRAARRSLNPHPRGFGRWPVQR